MTKMIYHFSRVTGEFAGEGLADLSPLEEDVWLIPAGATEQAPPAAEDGFRPVWTDSGWELREDLRGQFVWLADGSRVVVDWLGPLPEGASAEPPASVVAEARRLKRDGLLEQSDWTQLADTLLDQPELKAAWASYRRALRDLDMAGTAWPTPPGGES